MTVFATDNTHDLYLDSSGQIAVAVGREAYAEILRAAIQTVLGEIQLDTTLGIPYFESIMASSKYMDAWEIAVRNKITSYRFVRSITSFDIDVKSGKLSYVITVSTDDGVVTLAQ